MVYDKFGRLRGSMEFGSPEEPEVYQIDVASDSVTYLRYYDATPCAVWRISTSGTVKTIEVAIGAWADRASLTYHQPNTLHEA